MDVHQRLLDEIAGEGFSSSVARALEIPTSTPACAIATLLDEDDLDFLRQRSRQLQQVAQMQKAQPVGEPSIEYLLRLLVKQYRKEARY